MPKTENISINKMTAQWCEENAVPVWFLESTTSTNQFAKDQSMNPSVGVVLADHQSHGRGRENRTWANAASGATLLSTWCLPLSSAPQPIFSIRTGLVLFEALSATWPSVAWAIKAPNDIYIGDGKFAGILIEVEQQKTATAFIGIGANIFTAPQVDSQKTATLADHATVDNKKWSEFCGQFYKSLLEIQKDAHRSLLSKNEIDRLTAALEKYQGNQIKQLLPDGGLILKNNGSRHWNEL